MKLLKNKFFLVFFLLNSLYCTGKEVKTEFESACNDVGNFYKLNNHFINVDIVKIDSSFSYKKLFSKTHFSNSSCYPLNQIFLPDRDSPVL